MLTANADESVRLLLTDPKSYPIERMVGHARWVPEQPRFGDKRAHPAR